MPEPLPSYADAAAFLASPPPAGTTAVSIGGVVYEARAAEPPHADHKLRDAGGQWWSPDYLVVAAAGQSNMVGGRTGGDTTLSGNVMIWDAANAEVDRFAYVGGRNNLYLPFAEELAAETGRPVLVVARPVSGSRIESWMEGAANWEALERDIAAALAAVGQDGVDAVLWHQGEANSTMATATYIAHVEALVAQVRGASWGGAETAVLIGELSREGRHQAQNAALQILELTETDPFLAFVSSVGLTSAERDGVHFDGPSLVAFGLRYFDAWAEMIAGTPAPPNTAPILGAAAPTGLHLTLVEGQTLWLPMDGWFADAEGDDLWHYGTVSRRSVALIEPGPGGLWLNPGFDAAGTHTLRIYASDGELDGAALFVTVTVLDAAPGVSIFSNSSFTTLTAQAATLAAAQVGLAANRGIEILSQAALAPGGDVVRVEALTLRAGDGIAGTLTLAEPATRLTLQGEARLDVVGNGRDNLIHGNEAGNRLTGEAGRDRLHGNGGDDLLIGGAGDDQLNGGAGQDRLIGGAGRDQVWGQGGADVFVFEAGGGDLRVIDFADGLDRIEIAGFHLAGLEALLAAARETQSSTGLTIQIGADRLILDGMTLAQLSADDVVFV
jgi:hypothetical protein